MKWSALFWVLLVSLLSLAGTGNAAGNLILSLIQNNIGGPPVNFKTYKWPIDPEEGLRKSSEYQAVNGWLGNKQVERIGLGEDGRMEERRYQQIIRDQRGELSLKGPPYTTIP